MPVNIPGESRVVTRGRVIIGPSSYGMTAVGGNLVQDVSISGVTYRVHTFTSSGILTVTTGPTGTAAIEYLLVGGGGGGGAVPNNRSGGGGAGGFITGSLTLLSSGNYPISIGNGGGSGANGGDTLFGTSLQPSILIAYGGGFGGSAVGAIGASGGSGGGGGGIGGYTNPIPGGLSLFSQGNPGGVGEAGGGASIGQGGGGGGAGSAGNTGGPSNGGNARETFFRGFPEWFAAGGGGLHASPTLGAGGLGGTQFLGGRGAGYNPSTLLRDGVENTGSGGGGSGTGYLFGGGLGARGIAIIRYRIS